MDRMDSSSSGSWSSRSPEAWRDDSEETVMSLDFIMTSPRSGKRDVSTVTSTPAPTWTSGVGPVLSPASLHHLDRMEPGDLEDLLRMLEARTEEVFSLVGQSTTELDVEQLELLLASLLYAVETQYGVPISWIGLRSVSPSDDREDRDGLSLGCLVDMANMYFYRAYDVRDGCACDDGICTLWQREIADSVEVIEGLPTVHSLPRCQRNVVFISVAIISFYAIISCIGRKCLVDTSSLFCSADELVRVLMTESRMLTREGRSDVNSRDLRVLGSNLVDWRGDGWR
jgi:hypothetical protein